MGCLQFAVDAKKDENNILKLCKYLLHHYNDASKISILDFIDF